MLETPSVTAQVGNAREVKTYASGLRELRAVTQPFQRAVPRAAAWQLATTFLPLLALLAALHAGLSLGWWWALALGLPAAGLVVRVFALQHDCGHGSLFRTPRANDFVGRLCSLFTFTPYGHWRRQHAGHHAVWNDLDRRDRGTDIYSSCETVAEYRAMGRGRRRAYRTLRHPLMMLLVFPPLVFLVLYRIPYDAPIGWGREHRSVHLTNLSLLGLYGGLSVLLGTGAVVAGVLAVMVPASIAGVWLFSVQHRFEGVRWARHAVWERVAASLAGSSYLQLPAALRWLTASLGFHHVHHLAPRVPNHLLEACHDAHPAFATARVVTLREALSAPDHLLWDEEAGRMVTFEEADRPAAPASPGRTEIRATRADT
jgi:acyl-lipid omega-6 desaturase (Delta-12 desaturase)